MRGCRQAAPQSVKNIMPTPETSRKEAAPLAVLVSVQRRFLRSVNLERDFYSPDPLDGYLLTASAAAAFERLSAGIAQEYLRTKTNVSS